MIINTSGGDTQASYWDENLSQPYFDNTTKRDITVTIGQTAILHCKVRNLGDRAVSCNLFIHSYFFLFYLVSLLMSNEKWHLLKIFFRDFLLYLICSHLFIQFILVVEMNFHKIYELHYLELRSGINIYFWDEFWWPFQGLGWRFRKLCSFCLDRMAILSIFEEGRPELKLLGRVKKVDTF